jgi:hypothetical protein
VKSEPDCETVFGTTTGAVAKLSSDISKVNTFPEFILAIGEAVKLI